MSEGHALARLDNIVLTSHVEYMSRDTYEVFYEQTMQGIEAYLAGRPPRGLNPVVLPTARGMKH